MSLLSPSPTVGQRVVRASLAIATVHVLFKFLGLVQAIVVGRCMDSGVYDVVYAFAFEGIVFGLYVFAEDVIAPAFLPVFVRQLEQRDETAAWRFANAAITFQGIVLVAAVAVLMCFPEQIIRLCTAWNSTAGAAKFSLARDSLRWLAPSLICLSIGCTTYMILNAYGKFFVAALGSASMKVCVVLCIGIGIWLLGADYRVLFLGALLGSAAKLATHLAGLGRKTRLFAPVFDFRSPEMRTFFLLMAPLVVGVAFAQIRDIFTNVTMLSAVATEGLMKANSLGRKLHSTVAMLIPYAVSIAMFPFLCGMFARGDTASQGTLLTRACRMLLSVFVPFAVLCSVLSRPLAALFFTGGEFTPQVTAWAGVSLQCYVLVLPAYALEQVLIQAYFANGRILLAVAIGIVFSALTMAVSYVGIHVIGAVGAGALVVTAVGFTVARTLKTVAFVIFLRREMPLFAGGGAAAFFARCAMCSAGVGIVGWIASRATAAACPSMAGAPALECAVSGAAGLAAFVGLAWALKMTEPFEMWKWATDKLRGKLGRSAGKTGEP